MKVAFDVKGTLDGHRRVEVRSLLKYFLDQGAEITIWSNLYSYAADMADELEKYFEGVNFQVTGKYSFYDAQEQNLPVFDFCVEDDTGQWYLAAKQIVFVHTIPDKRDMYPELLMNAPKQEDLR